MRLVKMCVFRRSSPFLHLTVNGEVLAASEVGLCLLQRKMRWTFLFNILCNMSYTFATCPSIQLFLQSEKGFKFKHRPMCPCADHRPQERPGQTPNGWIRVTGEGGERPQAPPCGRKCLCLCQSSQGRLCLLTPIGFQLPTVLFVCIVPHAKL